MKDLQNRARACTDCHVGGDRAEVNHDLIAAGHPALLFENSSFLDRYRPYQHWSEADERRRHPAFEAETWAVGQVASAEAAMKLLRREPRATSRGRSSPSTTAHRATRPRNCTSRRPTGRPLGVPAWSWYTTMTPMLLGAAGPDGDPTTVLQQLREEMESRTPAGARRKGRHVPRSAEPQHAPETSARGLRGECSG